MVSALTYRAVLSGLIGCLALAGSALAQDQPALRLVTASPVSDQFRARSAAAIRSIPRRVLEGARRAGWEIHLAEFVVDVRPGLRESRPRGWPSTMTWKHSDAMNDVANRRLIVAEKRYTRDGRIVPNLRVGGVLRHELGHTFDKMMGGGKRFRSSSEPFLRAYRADLHQLHRRASVRRGKLTYYLQHQTAGRQEAFAEAFAIVLGGGSDTVRQEEFKESFPHVLEFVQRDVTSYRP